DVTGNSGNTTTKDFIYAALHKNIVAEEGDTLVLARKTSINSDSGVPLTILNLESGWTSFSLWLRIIINGFIKIFDKYEYKYLVLEIGADGPGDIQKICKYIKPDIAVLTAFAEVPVHIEFFDNDREKLIREKRYLIENIKKGGTFIYNLDDKDCVKIAEEMQEKFLLEGKDISLRSFSLHKDTADILAKDIKVSVNKNDIFASPTGMEAKIISKNKTFGLDMQGVLGEAAVYSLLPALLIAEELGVDIEKAKSDIENSKRTNGRMRILKGVHNSTIVDDTYNASPKAMQHGITMMKNISSKGKKIFVLGDMLELGEYTKVEHEKIGVLVKDSCDILVTSGIRAKIIAESAIKSGMNGENVFVTSSSIEAGREVLRILEGEVEAGFKEGKNENEIGGDLIFVKGSQGSRMERVVKMILAESHDSNIDLVRQDKMWKMR
ncbi:MAG: hypothetical protein RI945_317, partial [Candidatus Parcubacteria bacterium]